MVSCCFLVMCLMLLIRLRGLVAFAVDFGGLFSCQLLVGLSVLLLVDDDVVFVVYFGGLLGWRSLPMLWVCCVW